jgi:adenylylsulfate kinase-like enzyme
LIDLLIRDDLKSIPAKEYRDAILLGKAEQSDIRIPVYGTSVLVTPGAGKSNITSGVMERLIDARYQLSVFDPEGNYQTLRARFSLEERKADRSNRITCLKAY